MYRTGRCIRCCQVAVIQWVIQLKPTLALFPLIFQFFFLPFGQQLLFPTFVFEFQPQVAMLFGVKSVKLTLALPRGARRQGFGDSWHRCRYVAVQGLLRESKANGFATILARIYCDDFKLCIKSRDIPMHFPLFFLLHKQSQGYINIQ